MNQLAFRFQILQLRWPIFHAKNPARRLTRLPPTMSSPLEADGNPVIESAAKLPTTVQIPSPRIAGHPKRMARGIRASATLTCIGRLLIGANPMTRAAYSAPNTAASARFLEPETVILSLVSLLICLPTPGFVWRNGWKAPLTRLLISTNKAALF